MACAFKFAAAFSACNRVRLCAFKTSLRGGAAGWISSSSEEEEYASAPLLPIPIGSQFDFSFEKVVVWFLVSRFRCWFHGSHPKRYSRMSFVPYEYTSLGRVMYPQLRILND